MVIGSCTGAICGGFLSERFGRKKLLLFECTVFIFATLLCALAPNFKVLLISRVILGHCSASAMTSVLTIIVLWLATPAQVWQVLNLRRLIKK